MSEAPGNADALGLARSRPLLASNALQLLERDAVMRLLQLLVCVLAAGQGRIRPEAFRGAAQLGALREATGLPLPGTSPISLALQLPDNAWRAAREAIHHSAPQAFSSRMLGDAYQLLLTLKLVGAPAGGIRVARDRSGRKASGAWFTPDSLVTRLVRKTLAPLLRDKADVLALRVVDPALGTGHFLLATIDILAEHLVTEIDRCAIASPRGAVTLARRRLEVASRCVYGVDEDPVAVELARAVLWLHAPDASDDPRWPDAHLKAGNALVGASVAQLDRPSGCPRQREDLACRADAWIAPWFPRSERETPELSPFHWQLEFPDVAFDSNGSLRGGFGFDAVVGNPPWDRIRPEKRAFYAAHRHLVPGLDLSAAQGPSLDSLIAELERTHPALRDAWEQYHGGLLRLARFLRDSGTYLAQQADVGGRRAGGDPDLFRYFVERSFQCVRPGGRVGLVVPAALWQAEGCTGLRRMLLHDATLDEVCVFENRRKWAFDIDSRFKFSTFTATAAPAPEGHQFHAGFMLPGPDAWDAPDSPRFVRVSAELAARLSPGTFALPDFRSAHDGDLVARLHRANPCLGDSRSGWQFIFCRELDITTDARWFRTAAWMRERGFTLLCPTRDRLGHWTRMRSGPGEQQRGDPSPAEDRPGGEYWMAATEQWYREHGYVERHEAANGQTALEFIHPDDLGRSQSNPRKIPEQAFLIRPSEVCTPLYEGRMVHHFDHAQKRWVAGEGPRAVWASVPFEDKALHPRVFVAPAQVGAPRPHRIAFGAVASATNERSLLAALIPDDCLAGNSTPTLALPARDDAAVLLCVLCSFVFDYLVRLRTTTNINWTQLSRIAVPRPGDFPVRERRTLVEAAIRLSCTTPELAVAWNEVFPRDPWTYDLAERDPWRRAGLRATIDSLVADAYGLSPEDYARVLAAFPLLDRAQPALPGDRFVHEPPATDALPRSFITRDFALMVHLQRRTCPPPTDLHRYYRDRVRMDPDGPLSRFRIGAIRDLAERVQQARSLGAVPYVAPGG